jgi:hypothetical protein
MTYSTIPVFSGETRRLYREIKLVYIVSDPNHPNNYHVYSKYQDLGCSILSVNDEPIFFFTENVNISLCENNKPEEATWKQCFDGASS